MNKEEFLLALQKEVLAYNEIISTEKGDWIVKGFIDIYKNIYTISVDTKVVSKIIEILLTPEFEKFAKKYDLTLETQTKQNAYPDLTFICNKTKNKFAVDVKTTVKDSTQKIKSMTLGTYQGYFKNRDTKDNQSISYPYNEYCSHIIFGVIYSQVKEKPNEKEVYDLSELDKIRSVIRDFSFFVQPKYKIASSTKGSGNTRNIGSVRNIEDLINGKGIFSTLGEEIFDNYWMFFIDNQSSKENNIPRPYTDLKSYLEFKEKNIERLNQNKDLIDKIVQEERLDIIEEEENED